eukprot:sb/3472271/
MSWSVLVFVLLPLVAHSGITCLRCRRFGESFGVVRDVNLDPVESCASTLEECEHERCYSIQYVNASTGMKGEVRDCVGKSVIGYWKERNIKNALVKKGADRNQFSNFYMCSSDSCNNNQDILQCVDPTNNETYEVIDETRTARCDRHIIIDGNGTGNDSGYDFGNGKS